MRFILPLILSSFIILLGLTTSIYFINPYEVQSERISERFLGGKAYRIPSRSMQETLVPGDYIIVSLQAYQKYTPEKNDVIVFNYTVENTKKKTAFIKRVLAVGGNTIKIEKGIVFVNNSAISEPYVNPNNLQTSYSLTMNMMTVPTDKLFVLGDNRDNSNDSRLYGFISTRDVIGKATRLLYGKNGRSGNDIK